MRKLCRFRLLLKCAICLILIRMMLFLLSLNSNKDHAPWQDSQAILWRRNVVMSGKTKEPENRWDILYQLNKSDTNNHFQKNRSENPNQNNDDKEKEKQSVRQQEFDLPHFIASNPPDGAGENNSPVIIDASKLSETEKKKFDEGWKNNSFSQYVSDMISVNRRLPDVRNKDCQRQEYRWSLPEASVIICFHNEAWTVLLRSVHSILSRSPPRLLREIILVDDLSTMNHLKEPLDRYMSRFGKVKIVRAKTRQGLTRARLLGFSVVTGQVAVFLDSHIECFPGWLEPLLTPIAENPNTVTVPMIDKIDTGTFKISSSPDIHYLGAFDWSFMTFTWFLMSEERRKEKKSEADPVRSPTMPGGLFAISRDYFLKLGTYDPGLDYWGGENLELSFKVWMCNGTLEFIPCSHVAHVYRRNNPIKWPDKSLGFKNYIRVAEVWMDHYKNYFYEALNFDVKKHMGDISERKRLRESLHCKSFEWYRQTIMGDVDGPDRYPAAGEIRNLATQTCLDTMGTEQRLKMYFCHGQKGTQFWYLRRSEEISHLSLFICLQDRSLVLEKSCRVENKWEYRQDKTLFNKNTGLCLEADAKTNNISLQPCHVTKWQQWILQPRSTA